MMKVKVYLVSSGTYSDYRIEGVFSSKDKAQEFIDKSNICEINEEPMEWILDEKVGCVLMKVYAMPIELETGNFVGELAHFWYNLFPYNTTVVSRWDKMFFSMMDNNKLCFIAKSTVSEEHAKKLAVEARQRWLREGKPNMLEK